MPIKSDIPRAWKWNSTVKAGNTQPIKGKRRKVDDFTTRSSGDRDKHPSPTQFEKMTESFRSASNSVKGLFRRRSEPGSKYGNGKREFGERLDVSTGTLENQVTITAGRQMTLEGPERGLRRRELEERESEMRKRQRSLANSADNELRDPFADPSREGSQLSRWSTAGSLISKSCTPSHDRLPRNSRPSTKI
ncbi:hypothetical protein BGX38DRAFT_134996 [Terfezia claveryi]|nr:hypothetical protein BGX38DRAFT_134996 [Terfezia claveryi]